MTELALHPEDAKVIIDGLLKIPPASLKQGCTADQIQKWEQFKEGCLLLRKAIEDHFLGLGDEIEEVVFDKREAEKILLFRDYFLAWYQVVQTGWTFIQGEHNKGNIYLGDAKTPGFALLIKIHLMTLAQWEQVNLPYFEWTPHKARAQIKLAQQYAAIEGKTEKDVSRKKRLEKSMNSKVSMGKHVYERYVNFTCGLIQICKAKARKRDKALLRAIKTYEEYQAEVENFLLAYYHPRHKVSAQIWKRGVVTKA